MIISLSIWQENFLFSCGSDGMVSGYLRIWQHGERFLAVWIESRSGHDQAASAGLLTYADGDECKKRHFPP
jgi:hypothetical protein